VQYFKVTAGVKQKNDVQDYIEQMNPAVDNFPIMVTPFFDGIGDYLFTTRLRRCQ
jgi:hypothetical protein